jgi:diaminopimelate epimerase
LNFRHVSIGNPQCAIYVSDFTELEALDLATIGPAIERHQLFPNRTNVSWYTEIEPSRIRARIFERGVGPTWSSGTGAIGAAVAHHLRRGTTTGQLVTVGLPGGDLEVEVGEDLHINLTGEAQPVFEGTLSKDFLKELDAIQ